MGLDENKRGSIGAWIRNIDSVEDALAYAPETGSDTHK
jgi:hypothetical protein